MYLVGWAANTEDISERNIVKRSGPRMELLEELQISVQILQNYGQNKWFSIDKIVFDPLVSRITDPKAHIFA